MGDVLEYLVDGTSGLAPGGVDGKAIIAGVCSKGEVGKAYLLGKRSNLAGLLGTGPLVDSLRDVLATGGQEPVIVAVPVQGQSGGYISQPHITGSSVKAHTAGVAQSNADVIVTVTAEGALGAAALSVSLDGGETSSTMTSAASMPLGSTGATLVFPAGASLEADAVFRITVRTAIGTAIIQEVGDKDHRGDYALTGQMSISGNLIVGDTVTAPLFDGPATGIV